ncbi:MAG: amino acid--tRNA ligase-related protein [Pseudomonadota bacterium]
MLKIIHNKYFYISLVAAIILALAFFVFPVLLPATFVISVKSDLASTTPLVPIATTSEPAIIKKVITEDGDSFDANNFIEIETPLLQSIYGGASAKPFKTHLLD